MTPDPEVARILVVLKNILFGAALSVCVIALARGIAALPKALHGDPVGLVHTSEELLIETLNGDL